MTNKIKKTFTSLGDLGQLKEKLRVEENIKRQKKDESKSDKATIRSSS